MITTEPSTWHNLTEHPSFLEFRFGENWKEWYEGESPESDLALLRKCALELLEKLPTITAKLTVLDDLTTFVELSYGTVSGQFGIGCEPETLYLQLDADPSDKNAAEVDRDNLCPTEIMETIKDLAGQKKETGNQ